jgi:hypothetical protein
MAENEWERQSWEQLATEADTGLKGQGAVVEAMRRLTDRLNAFSKSSDAYANRMFWLTIVILGFTIVQIVVAVIEGIINGL